MIFKIRILAFYFFAVTIGTFSVECEAQTEKHFTIDSFYFSSEVYNFGKYEMLSNKTPLALYGKGIFMPKENLWFYRPMPQGTLLKDFAISVRDTSVLVMEKFNKKTSIFRIPLTSKFYYPDNDKKKILFSSDDSGFRKVYPFNEKYFFLLKQDSLSHVYRQSQNKTEKMFSSRILVQTLIPVDTATFVMHSGNIIFLYSSKTGIKTIFRNSISIRSMVMNAAGRLFYSDDNGIYEFDLSTKKSKQIDNLVGDAVLGEFIDKIYAFSIKRKNMYVYSSY